MLEILFNGKKISVAQAINLAELLVQQGYADGGFAVAVNQEYVPRAEHFQRLLVSGDKVDVMTPMQGG
jgi:sulfur carrier protein